MEMQLATWIMLLMDAAEKQEKQRRNGYGGERNCRNSQFLYAGMHEPCKEHEEKDDRYWIPDTG